MAWAFCWVVDSHVDSNAGNGKSGLDSFLTIKGWRRCGGRRSVDGHKRKFALTQSAAGQLRKLALRVRERLDSLLRECTCHVLSCVYPAHFLGTQCLWSHIRGRPKYVEE